MSSNVVLGVAHHNFEDLIENYKLTKGVTLDNDFDAEDWKKLIKGFREVIKRKIKKGKKFRTRKLRIHIY